eukprot:9439188-Alexandrium_andersonii.AAC.1
MSNGRTCILLRGSCPAPSRWRRWCPPVALAGPKTLSRSIDRVRHDDDLPGARAARLAQGGLGQRLQLQKRRRR